MTLFIAEVPNLRAADWYWSLGPLVLGHTERISNLFPFYLLSESELCFILKNGQVLSVTSAYDSVLTHVYYYI